eukprot:gene15666-17573_t
MYLLWFFVKEHHPHEKDLDWASFFFAKTAKLYLPRLFPGNDTQSLNDMRQFLEFFAVHPTRLLIKAYPDPFELIHSNAIDVKIPVEFDDFIIARIYNGHEQRAVNSSNEELKPVLVWFHGGGLVLGSLELAHLPCLKYANYTGYIIVNVDYRLAPDYIFPTPLNDAYSAFLWVEEHIEKYGGDRRRLTIGGDSAGGYLATAVSARYLESHMEKEKEKNCVDVESEEEVKGGVKVREGECAEIEDLPSSNLKGLLAVYPMLNATTDTEEAKRYDQTSGILSIEIIEWVRQLHQGSPTTDMSIRSHYWFSPFNTPREILRFFPPTIFVIARYDVLAEEGLQFRQKLEEIGVKTSLLYYEETIHGFLGNSLIPSGEKALIESSELLMRVVTAN